MGQTRASCITGASYVVSVQQQVSTLRAERCNLSTHYATSCRTGQYHMQDRGRAGLGHLVQGAPEVCSEKHDPIPQKGAKVR